MCAGYGWGCGLRSGGVRVQGSKAASSWGPLQGPHPQPPWPTPLQPAHERIRDAIVAAGAPHVIARVLGTLGVISEEVKSMLCMLGPAGHAGNQLPVKGSAGK